MPYNIVAFQEELQEKLVQIWYRAVRQTHHFLKEEDLQFYLQVLENGALKDVEIWVALQDSGEPMGFIGIEGSKIEMLFVDPTYHGKGIGTLLIKHIEKLKGSSLTVDVNEQNEGAHAFYRRYGFVQTGRSEFDFSGRPYPLLHLELQR